MDNIKMGTTIREARKKKGYTQKDIATQLSITDRAVSKWERGLCAPDLALLEPLADMLEISITELITGEQENLSENKEKYEFVVKETIQYSKQENAKKKKNNRKNLAIFILVILFLCGAFVFLLFCNGFFHKIGSYPSPDGTTIASVYSCNLHYDNRLPTNDGFTVETTGLWNGMTTYRNSKFRGLWWSPNGKYKVISMYDSDNNAYFELTDYIRNKGCNLSAYLEIALEKNKFFSNVLNNNDCFPDINFEFIQWSEKDPAVLLFYFCYNDINGDFHEGYMWYDYESGTTSGEMELKQGEKDIFFLHEAWDGMH